MIDKDTLNQAHALASNLHTHFESTSFSQFIAYCRHIAEIWDDWDTEWKQNNPHQSFATCDECQNMNNKAALKSLRVITKMAYEFAPVLMEINQQVGLKFDEVCEKLEGKLPPPPWVNHK